MFSKGRNLLYIVPLILGFLFTRVEDVFAQTETPPPPPQYLPTQITNKPEIADTACPDGNPTGFGVKTPSALWWNLCGQCLTNYGIDTTPTPIITPETSPTVTPTNYATFVNRLQLDSTPTIIPIATDTTYELEHTTAAGSTFKFGFDPYSTISGWEYEFGWQWDTLIHYNYWLNQSNRVKVTYYCLGEFCDIYDEFGLKWHLTYDDKATEYLDPLNAGVQEKHMKYDVHIKTNTSGGVPFSFYTQIVYGNNWVRTNYKFKWTGINKSIFTETEEGGGGTGYCSSIKEEGESGSFEDVLGFKYNGFQFGQSYCANIGPYDFNFLGLEFTIPYIAYVCVQDVSIGTISVLGTSMSLDGFSIILACAWILRNLFIS